ncbi:MAG TPA: NAD(P)H-hydrate epimerase [Planctomycetota bacterium]|nr:NAD(P)H-hydrate epimerase [Planctomycetota bacterium]
MDATSGLSEASLGIIARENSARELALWALSASRARGGAAPVVAAGRGAAGAVALAAARMLANWELAPRVLVLGLRDRLGSEGLAELAILERCGGRAEQVLRIDGLRELLAGLGPDTPLLYGAAGDDSSQKATEMADLVNQAGTARAGLSRMAAFSVRSRTSPPEPGALRIRVEAEPRDAEAVRLLDSTAIRGYGIPGLALMESAGYWAAAELWRRLAEPARAAVVVLAGRGNNGGDGFVIARHLAWWGVGSVRVLLAGRAAEVIDDARVNLDYLSAPGVAVEELAAPDDVGRAAEAISRADWLVDALLGTGLTGKVRGTAAELIAVARSSGRPVLAVDTPSGLDASDGSTLGTALPATVTVTFGVPKRGFSLGAGPGTVGELVVAEIGLPRRITGARVVAE